MYTPKVSVLIPTYNYAHFLDEAIQSVLQQTFTDFEVIICDNHSTDNTQEVVKKYLSDSRIYYYRNATNIGLVGNWNKCLELANGKYIKFLCADDKFNPQLLEKFIAVAGEYPTVSLITCYRQGFGSNSSIFKVPVTGFYTGHHITKLTLQTYGWLGEPSAVMFRSNTKKTTAFKGKYKWLTDWEMWLQQLQYGDCYIIPEPLACVRIHASQITKSVMKNYVNYFEEYELCQNIKAHRGYNIDTTDIDMDAVLKMRAAKCAKVVYKVLPQLYKKAQRQLFVNAFKIAWKESVLLDPLKKIIIGRGFKSTKAKTQMGMA
ncbi:glycosyltransferase family 2 protein [Ilyomonas limi]|uniref:Glycosyltransferase family 2 protein n=1 Tax=Ilyomonas limi TaxID=2575867 RepID=A0A4U3KRN3_9BACT|nr:glycosyltransferase family A protein [Ilyomonas limi]TKK65008.1 glycosyltransferase family 2 protein [Ilyomonas limi]